MDYKEKFEFANNVLMKIMSALIMYHITDDSKKCAEVVDELMVPYALFRKEDLEKKIFGNKDNKDEEV